MKEVEILALISLLDDEDRSVFNHVREKLLTLGAQILPFLQQRLKNSTSEIQSDRILEIQQEIHFQDIEYRFSALFSAQSIDLTEALFLISFIEYPSLTFDQFKGKIDQIYYEVWLECSNEFVPMEYVRVINRVLFEKLKFRPHYVNPNTSSATVFNTLLETKKGNQLSLTALYYLVFRKFRIEIAPIEIQNFYFLSFNGEFEQFYINPWTLGSIFSKRELKAYIKSIGLEDHVNFYLPCSMDDFLRGHFLQLISSYSSEELLKKSKFIEKLLHMLENRKSI